MNMRILKIEIENEKKQTENTGCRRTVTTTKLCLYSSNLLRYIASMCIANAIFEKSTFQTKSSMKYEKQNNHNEWVVIKWREAPGKIPYTQQKLKKNQWKWLHLFSLQNENDIISWIQFLCFVFVIFFYPFVVKLVLLLGIKKKDFAMAFMCHRSSFITFKVIQNMSWANIELYVWV